ncbi:hypothetical protein RND81_08G080000 [Saponaria officinalis]|uniref:Uncharacterized protein n=1 Tax=Saponaria officinalis TaxID=3572 RepID=A0AAW1J4V3_SAPOF
MLHARKNALGLMNIRQVFPINLFLVFSASCHAKPVTPPELLHSQCLVSHHHLRLQRHVSQQ